MGFIGKMLGGIFDGIFGRAETPQIPQVSQIKATDIAKSSEAATPESPVLGTSNTSRIRGRKQLLINQIRNKTNNNNYNPTNL